VPSADATIEATLKTPSGEERALKIRSSARKGQSTADVTVDRAGLYQVHVRAQRGADILGEADAWFSAGGDDREFADPRLNEGWLRRLARASGGRYVRALDAAKILPEIRAGAVQSSLEPRDVWNTPGVFGAIVLAMSLEWTLRRRWGLR
jgi:hypothetical protein